MSEKIEITAKDVRDGVLAALKKAIDMTAGTIFGNNQKEENGLKKLAKADSEFDTPAELDSAIRKYYDASRKFKLAIPKQPKGMSGSSKAIFGGAPAAGPGDSKGAPVAKAEVTTNSNACVKCEKGEIASLSLSKTSMESLKLDKSFEHGLCKSCGSSYKRQALVNKNDETVTSNSPWDLEKALQEDYVEVPMNGVVVAKKKPGAKLPPEKSEDVGNTDEGEIKSESLKKALPGVAPATAAPALSVKDEVAAKVAKMKWDLANKISSSTDSRGTTRWLKGSTPHRDDDLPAIDSPTHKVWYKDGVQTRDGGKPSSVTDLGGEVTHIYTDNTGKNLKHDVFTKDASGALIPHHTYTFDESGNFKGEIKHPQAATGPITKGAISDAVAATREKLKGKLSNLSEGEARRAGFPGVPKDAKDTNTKPSTDSVQKSDGIPSAPKAPAPTNLNKQSLTTPPTGVQPASQNKLPV